MTTRRLVLGLAPVEITLESDALVERFDWRYGGAEWEAPSGATAAVSLSLAPGSGEPLDIAWQPSLQTTRRGDVIAADWPGARGRFDVASRRGRFEVRTDARGFGLAVDDVLRVVGWELALRDGALLLHAAAVGPAGADWCDAFAGRSGAGKTTVTEKLVRAGETAISDDLVFVESRGEQARALPTPFKGATEAPRLRRRASRLRSIAFLEQAAAASCEPIEGPEQVVKILSATVRYRALLAEEAGAITALAFALAKRSRAFALALTLADDPRAVLDSAVS